MKTLKLTLTTLIVILGQYNFAQYKWHFVALKSSNIEDRNYVIDKIKNTSGLKYIAYCPTHQGIFFKYDASVFLSPSDVINSLKESDTKLNDLLLEKVYIDEKNIIDLTNYCDFDVKNGELIKQELQN
ncbi:MAG TPA: hypothetical protein PK995_07350 [Bacteroidia bacterium]|mgnify:CR=1 FL=1|nr:hypothetical protein [Bacteroidia bacterium]